MGKDDSSLEAQHALLAARLAPVLPPPSFPVINTYSFLSCPPNTSLLNSKFRKSYTHMLTKATYMCEEVQYKSNM